MDDASRERLVAAYEAVALKRDTAQVATWRYSVADDFFERLPPHPRILDLGAGTGQYGDRFARMGATVTAMDLTPAHVELCRAKGLDAIVGDFITDDLGTAAYDGVWALNSLLHVPKLELSGVLGRIWEALVPGGLALICVWGGVDLEGTRDEDGYDPPRFLALYTDEQFAQIPTAGMERLDTWTLDVDEGGLHPQLMLLRRS
jgi:SAM-dependent methyltransferase